MNGSPYKSVISPYISPLFLSRSLQFLILQLLMLLTLLAIFEVSAYCVMRTFIIAVNRLRMPTVAEVKFYAFFPEW